METGFAIFILAVTGLLLGMVHTTRQAEQQLKAELVPVRVKRNFLRKFCYERFNIKRLV